MKKIVLILSLIFVFCISFNINDQKECFAENSNEPMLAIVIDDFGGYERAGVDKIMGIKEKITCAIIPFSDNTEADFEKAKQNNHEAILHMPMEAHVTLPNDWYGKIVIRSGDSELEIINKLDESFQQLKGVNGANMHIGSGISKNQRVMKVIYDYMKQHNMFFLDSRTIVGGVCEQVCEANNLEYLGRDVFLEADKNKNYNAVVKNIKEACNIAKEKGYAIAIGHVGMEGGENTADAIIDMLPEIKKMGIKIVPLSAIYEHKKMIKNI